MKTPQVMALIATRKRPDELRRLGQCLATQTRAVAGAVIADNGPDTATEKVAQDFPVPCTYLRMPENRGCGAGLRAAEEHLLQKGQTGTHWWILDDDAVPPPECLERLLNALQISGAALSVPLLTDAQGEVWSFPEPVDATQRSWFRETKNKTVLAERFGSTPHRCLWATGACQLVQVHAALQTGLHRSDFWMLGEDLDFSMRLAGTAQAVFLGDLFVRHLPPSPQGREAPLAAKAKFEALLQNLTYLALWNAHSAHIWKYVPGNARRYLQNYGWNAATLFYLAICLGSGCLGMPAGRGGAQWLRRRRKGP